jgi:hypothetical protein
MGQRPSAPQSSNSKAASTLWGESQRLCLVPIGAAKTAPVGVGPATGAVLHRSGEVKYTPRTAVLKATRAPIGVVTTPGTQKPKYVSTEPWLLGSPSGDFDFSLLYSANIVCGFWGDPTSALPLSKGPTPTHPHSLRTFFERKNYARVPQRSAPTPCWERPSVLSYATITPKLNTASTYIPATYQTLDLSLFNMNVVIADYLAPAFDFAVR